ncbi:response regulator receiver protein, partial [Pseudonocardia hispaniensis]
MIDEPARCGYSRCRAELPPPGPQGGRRRSFCRDTRWPGGRTCAQMARAEREALGALGLDAGTSTFQLDADRLREHVEAVRGPVQALGDALAAVSTRLDEVQRDAVAAVEAANRRVADADRARVAAEEARAEAQRQARQSAEAAERAAQERTEAVQRASAAARQALEATEALGAAKQAAEEAVGARRAAEHRAAAAEQ